MPLELARGKPRLGGLGAALHAAEEIDLPGRVHRHGAGGGRRHRRIPPGAATHGAGTAIDRRQAAGLAHGEAGAGFGNAAGGGHQRGAGGIGIGNQAGEHRVIELCPPVDQRGRRPAVRLGRLPGGGGCGNRALEIRPHGGAADQRQCAQHHTGASNPAGVLRATRE
nr:hypothetical protein [Denitromonas sp.]